jgi:glucosylceramidase
LTESSAFVLAHLEPEKRKQLLEEIFGEKGANFAIVRTHIASCDFSVEGNYTYAPVENDTLLEHFTIQPDQEGFKKEKYPGIKDETYDLLPLIKEVNAIKKGQADSEFRIIASPWSAAPWMKTNNAYYKDGKGGTLKEEDYQVYANYFVKYFDAYKKEGINIWAITPENEPEGNNGSWESMELTPEQEAKLIANNLGPTFEKAGYGNIKIFGFDQNRDRLPAYADEIYKNEEAAKYTDGMAVHWYSSTFKVYEEVFNEVHQKYPDKTIIHTEGCIDNLGAPAPDQCTEKIGWVESGWFMNDKWWWEKHATDWGYCTPWHDPAFHPMYSPVHRYMRDIIVGMNNWMTGFVEWNIVLDKKGTPNHTNNFCGAPVMIDTETGEIHFTPVYNTLKQLSRNIRPGDVALHVPPVEGALADSIYVGAILNKQNEVVINLLNVSQNPIEINLGLDEEFAAVTAPANSLQTLVVPIKMQP